MLLTLFTALKEEENVKVSQSSLLNTCRIMAINKRSRTGFRHPGGFPSSAYFADVIRAGPKSSPHTLRRAALDCIMSRKPLSARLTKAVMQKPGSFAVVVVNRFPKE